LNGIAARSGGGSYETSQSGPLNDAVWAAVVYGKCSLSSLANSHRDDYSKRY
jgi:hypothetical protein